jgi:hypothetical protein
MRFVSTFEHLEVRLALSDGVALESPEQPVEVVQLTQEPVRMEAGVDGGAEDLIALAAQSGVAPRFERSAPVDPTPLRAVGSAVITRGPRTLGFTVRFNGPLATEPALDLRNYRVFEVSKPDRFLSQLLYQDDDVRFQDLPIKAVRYVADENTVVLLLQSPRKLSPRYRVGLASPAEAHPVRAGEQPLATLADTEGNAIEVPTTRRGTPKRGPITLRPRGRIKLESRAAAAALAAGDTAAA